jgi:hypothetical protein
MVVWEGGGTAEDTGVEGAKAGRRGDGLGRRSRGGDRQREDVADAACRWPMCGSRMEQMGWFVRARGIGRVRARRGGGGIPTVYTIVLIVSRDLL